MKIQHIKKSLICPSILSIVCLAIAGCGNNKNNAKTATATSADTSSSILKVDIGAEVPSVDPQLVEDANSIRVSNDLFQGVLQLDQSNVPIPGLAKSWDISKDKKTYTFHLRKNIKFSNGEPITADDFVYSWQRLVDPTTGSPYTYIASTILNATNITNKTLSPSTLGVRALDNQTLQLTLQYPDSDILAKLTMPAFSVVSKSNIAKYGNAWTAPENIATSGAYTLKQHVINGYMLLSKNPYYYNKNQVKINTVKFFPLVDTNASISKYKTGDLDMTWSVPVDQYKALGEEYKDQMHTTPIEGVIYYDLNMLRPEFKDVRVRQALTMAIDRVQLTKEVLGTGVVPSYSIITPSISGGKYASVAYPWVNQSRSQQVATAQNLYKAAGFGPNHPLKLTITYSTDDEKKKVALAVASMWHNVLGANVTVQNIDWKTFLQNLRQGDYQIGADRWIADYNGVTTYTQMYVCNAPENSSKYCNPAYDNLIKLATYSNDAKKSQEYYTKALNIALNDYSVIPLYQPSSRRLVSKNVKGYTPETNHLDRVYSEWMDLGKE